MPLNIKPTIWEGKKYEKNKNPVCLGGKRTYVVGMRKH